MIGFDYTEHVQLEDMRSSRRTHADDGAQSWDMIDIYGKHHRIE